MRGRNVGGGQTENLKEMYDKVDAAIRDNWNVKCEEVGTLCGGKWDNLQDISRRVYGTNGIAPTVHTCGGGNQELKIAEPQALRMVRTDEGKALRKQYEAGEIKHGYNEHRQAQMRNDGLSGTVTTVEKDNYIAEPVLWGGVGEKNFGSQYRQGNRIYDANGAAMAIMASNIGNTGGDSYLYAVEEPKSCAIRTRAYDGKEAQVEMGGEVANSITTVEKDSMVCETQIRIRKITEKESFRLMGVKDEDFERVKKNQSNSSLRHLAGDSIVTTCLMAIFGQMIDGHETDYERFSYD